LGEEGDLASKSQEPEMKEKPKPWVIKLASHAEGQKDGRGKLVDHSWAKKSEPRSEM